MKNIIAIILIVLAQMSGFSEPKKKGVFDPESVKLVSLALNTNQSDFGPALIGDSLFFTSFRDELLSKTDKNLQKKEFYSLFSTKIDKEGNIAGKRHVIKDFTTKYHDGPVSYCPATGELFITQSNYLEPGAEFKPFRLNYFNLRIVIAIQERGAWKVVESFPFNNAKYSVGHPAISNSGDTLVFSSNKPGGYGETDLYMSVRKKGLWGEPVNLGSRINTSGKDEFPFLSKDGHLIFASSGRQGIGGLDIYYTKLNDPKSEIVHFDSPINSPYDDFSMVLLPDAEYGYLTSNRPGGVGGDDIYKINFSKYKDNFLKLMVMDTKSRKPIRDADVSFEDKIDFKTGNEGELSRKIENEMSYSLSVKAFGYSDKTKTITAGIMKNGAVVYDTIWMDIIVKKNIALKNIYYDYDKWDILPASIEELDKLTAFMIENPEVKVELGSHTDSRGTEIYNQNLSERRAQSAVDYIISKGIDKDRIIAKGYGESMPVNKCVDNIICTPQEFRMNRRTEFYIPEFGKSESVDQRGIGDYSTEVANKPKAKRSAKETSDLVKSNKYSVIVGAFFNALNADKVINQLKVDGYQSELITEAKTFKVGVSYKDFKSAREGLGKLKTKYPRAWIL